MRLLGPVSSVGITEILSPLLIAGLPKITYLARSFPAASTTLVDQPGRLRLGRELGPTPVGAAAHRDRRSWRRRSHQSMEMIAVIFTYHFDGFVLLWLFWSSGRGTS